MDIPARMRACLSDATCDGDFAGCANALWASDSDADNALPFVASVAIGDLGCNAFGEDAAVFRFLTASERSAAAMFDGLDKLFNRGVSAGLDKLERRKCISLSRVLFAVDCRCWLTPCSPWQCITFLHRHWIKRRIAPALEAQSFEHALAQISTAMRCL